MSVKPLVRPLYSIDFERFRLTSSTNIDNLNFAILVISDRSKDTRFHQNYEVQKTLQNLSKIQNFDAFATSKTSKCSISHRFCRLFRLLGFVAKRLCDRLANSQHNFGKDYKLRLDLKIMFFLVRVKPPNMRIRTMKIDCFDTVEKYGIDSLTKGP